MMHGAKQSAPGTAGGHNFRTEYDVSAATRSRTFVLGTERRELRSANHSAEVLYEKMTYGEGQLAALNLRTRIFQHADAAGIVTKSWTQPDHESTMRASISRATSYAAAEDSSPTI